MSFNYCLFVIRCMYVEQWLTFGMLWFLFSYCASSSHSECGSNWDYCLRIVSFKCKRGRDRKKLAEASNQQIDKIDCLNWTNAQIHLIQISCFCKIEQFLLGFFYFLFFVRFALLFVSRLIVFQISFDWLLAHFSFQIRKSNQHNFNGQFWFLLWSQKKKLTSKNL